jgi:hypothetical protein
MSFGPRSSCLLVCMVVLVVVLVVQVVTRHGWFVVVVAVGSCGKWSHFCFFEITNKTTWSVRSHKVYKHPQIHFIFLSLVPLVNKCIIA